MISLLRGTVAGKQAGTIIVDVGGVGYDVSVPASTYSRIGAEGEKISLHVHTHVRENVLALFGFHKRRDKDLFEKFLDVSGVGPRLAVAMLSGLESRELVGAIRDADTKKLTRIPGVGKKTGQRIVLELKDKLSGFDGDDGGIEGAGGAVAEDVVSALTNLGCSREAARKGVEAALRKGVPVEFEELFRVAMTSMKR